MDRKRIAALFLIVLADMSGATAILPIIPVYVLGQFHATPFEAALVIPAYYVAQILAAPLDHICLPFGLAGGLVVIYLARLLDGVTGGNISVAQAYASDISTLRNGRGRLG